MEILFKSLLINFHCLFVQYLCNIRGFHQGGSLSTTCRQENLKYFPYFTVISVEIGHFEHQNLKTLIFFLLGEYPQGGVPPDPAPVLDPPPLKHSRRKP